MNQEYLKSILSYDPETGVFVWIKARPRVVVGNRAGSIDKDGYRIIKIDQKNYRCGRLAIFYMTGVWPEGEADHKNLIKDNDAWINIRAATKGQNMSNVRVRSHSATGIKGVQKHRHGGNYYAKITVDNKRINLGTFRKKTDAAAAYRAAALQHRGEFARHS